MSLPALQVLIDNVLQRFDGLGEFSTSADPEDGRVDLDGGQVERGLLKNRRQVI